VVPLELPVVPTLEDAAEDVPPVVLAAALPVEVPCPPVALPVEDAEAELPPGDPPVEDDPEPEEPWLPFWLV